MMPEICLFGVLEYYRYLINKKGISWLFSLTDTRYPKFLALGWRLGDEIIVCRIGNYELRMWHELGHYVGMGHVKERGHVMHPWGICRGWKGKEEIEKLL